ncbi:MAG: hypothetical protein V3T99_03655 [Nitrososphaerales archaeon]
MTRNLQCYPVYGTLEPRFFTLPEVNKRMASFLSEIIFLVQHYLTVSVLAVLRHPELVVGNRDVFFPAFTWNTKFDLDDNFRSNFNAEFPPNFDPERHSFLINVEFDPEKSLASEFLRKMRDSLKGGMELQDIERLNGFELTTGKHKTISRVNGFWLIENPVEFKNFTNTLKGHKTEWTFYYPLRISNRLVGLFAVDSIAPLKELKDDLEMRVTSGKMKPIAGQKSDALGKLEAVAKMVEMTVESIFQSYYTQLETPPENMTLSKQYWKRSEEGFVLSPAYLNEVNKTPIIETLDGLKYEMRIVYFFDANGIKKINDGIKHTAGTEVIRSVGRWIYESFRQVIAELTLEQSCRFWVIRWGGDEFIVTFATEDGDRVDLTEFEDTLNSTLRKTVLKGIRALITELSLKKWLREFQQQKDTRNPVDAKTVKDKLNKVGIAGGYAYFDKEYRDTRDKAEDAMYTAKELMKKYIPENVVLCLRSDRVKEFSTSVEESVWELIGSHKSSLASSRSEK